MKRIMVVDDNKLVRIKAKSVLHNTYEVITTSGGAEALEFLEKDTCDLILLDICMPEMDGFEVIEKIRQNERYSGIPIIFLTAENNPETESRCFEAGASDYIVKPFAPVAMLSRISHILELEEMRRKLVEKLEMKTQEASELKSRSQQDALTGLWNRTYIERVVNNLISAGESGTFLMIDMDNFKTINDHYGHIAGDDTLKMFAETLRKFSVEDDVLCRIGGDEFAMFIRGAASKAEIGYLASGIISDLSAKLKACKYETNSAVSIGIAQTPEDGKDFTTLYRAADKALYYVKQNGKNSYHFFSEQREAENERAGTLVDLRYLREFMSRDDSNRGAYMLDIDSFHHVYNFIRRFVERNNHDVQTILFTMYPKEVSTPQEEIDDALEILEQAVFMSLRRVDVSTRYSSQQLIVILMDADTINGDMVAERVAECFTKIYSGNSVILNFDIAKMEAKKI